MDKISLDTTFGSFLRDLGSDLPAPGGGAVSGISGALGASLGRMVASLTVGRKKYEAYSENTAKCIDQLTVMTQIFMDLAAKDASAYTGYMQAVSLPKNTEEEAAARSQAMQKAIRNSAAIPYNTIRACSETLLLIESLYGKSNKTCVGDLAAGAAELACAAKLAWLNVLANLPYFDNHEDASALYTDAKDSLESVVKRASDLYASIEHELEIKL